MKNVICDTNIWYGIGAKTILPSVDLHLCATWSNIIELAYAHPCNKKDFDVTLWRSAAQAILTYSQNTIELDPFEFSVQKLFPHTIQVKPKNLKQILKIITEKDKPLEESIYHANRIFFDLFLKLKDQFVEKLLNHKAELRKELLGNPNLKKTFKNDQGAYFDLRAYELLLDINDHLGRLGSEIRFENDEDARRSLERVSQEFNLHIATKQRFLRNLTLMKSMTVEPNDFVDLVSLMYVGAADYYWTLESRWLNLIEEAGMAGKLIRQDHRPLI